MEEKNVSYKINGVTYNVTRKFSAKHGSLLEKLVEYFNRFKPDEVGEKEYDEENTNSNQ